jgi:hypothetical protein
MLTNTKTNVATCVASDVNSILNEWFKLKPNLPKT